MTPDQKEKYQLSEKNIQNRDQIKSLLLSIKRKGIEEFVNHLEFGTDFFYAPASTQYHGSVIGGLANHSLNVYNLLVDKVKYFNLNVDEDSLKIVALTHDFCKVNSYEPGEKWFKDADGKWQSEAVWKVVENLPFGHSEKSIIMLQQYFLLKEEEIAGILYHMGAYTPGITQYPYSATYNEAIKKYPLVMAMHVADMEESNIVSNFCPHLTLDK